MMKKGSNKPVSDAIETKIATKAAGAFAKARKRAVAAKQYVVVAKDGDLVRISPAGERTVVGKVKPPTKKMAIRFEKDVEIAIQWTTSQD